MYFYARLYYIRPGQYTNDAHFTLTELNDVYMGRFAASDKHMGHFADSRAKSKYPIWTVKFSCEWADAKCPMC